MAAPPSADMTAKHTFLEATVVRRSTIALTSESPIPDDRIIALVQHAIKHAPTPFHTQSARAVILLGAEHTKFWELAYTKCEPQFPPEVFQGKFVPNLTAFKNAHGTALFFDEPEAIDKLPPPLAGLVKNFPEWQEHANGMAQYIAWTALCDAGLGANLQHYQKYLGPALNESVGAPANWNCRAQLVFGKPNGPPRGGVEKTFADIDESVKVRGA